MREELRSNKRNSRSLTKKKPCLLSDKVPDLRQNSGAQLCVTVQLHWLVINTFSNNLHLIHKKIMTVTDTQCLHNYYDTPSPNYILSSRYFLLSNTAPIRLSLDTADKIALRKLTKHQISFLICWKIAILEDALKADDSYLFATSSSDAQNSTSCNFNTFFTRQATFCVNENFSLSKWNLLTW